MVTRKENGTAVQFIEVDQNRAIDELHEVEFDNKLMDNLKCTPSMHTEYRSVLGQLDSQFHTAYRFSRCASAAASPTIAVSKLVRSVRAEPVTLRYWSLRGVLRTVEYPDASYRTNEDKSSQRGQAIFRAEGRSSSGNVQGALLLRRNLRRLTAPLSTPQFWDMPNSSRIVDGYQWHQR